MLFIQHYGSRYERWPNIFLPLPVETLLHESCLNKSDLLLLTHGIRKHEKYAKPTKQTARYKLCAIRYIALSKILAKKRKKLPRARVKEKHEGKGFFRCFINGKPLVSVCGSR